MLDLIQNYNHRECVPLLIKIWNELTPQKFFKWSDMSDTATFFFRPVYLGKIINTIPRKNYIIHFIQNNNVFLPTLEKYVKHLWINMYTSFSLGQYFYPWYPCKQCWWILQVLDMILINEYIYLTLTISSIFPFN